MTVPFCADGLAHDWHYGIASYWCGRCWLAIPYRKPRTRLNVTPNGGGPSVRDQVIERDGYRCRYCGISVRPGRPSDVDRLTLDHVTPVSRNGPNTVENLVVACQDCNSRKGDLTLDEWLETAGFRIWNYWRTTQATA